MQIQKVVAPDPAEVAAAKEAFDAAVATQAKLKQRSAAAAKKSAELEEAAGDAAVRSVAEDDDAIYTEASAAHEAAKGEARKLAIAVKAAERQVQEARMTVARVSHAQVIGKIGKQCERRLGSALKLEKLLEDAVAEWRRLAEITAGIRTSWPGGNPPQGAGLNVSAYMWSKLEETIYKLSFVPNSINAPKRGAGLFPGARFNPGDPRAGQPHLIPSLSDTLVQDHAFLIDVLKGVRDGRTGVSIGTAAEAPAEAPAEQAGITERGDPEELASEFEMEALLNPKPSGPKRSAEEIARELKAKK
jgi:hypothetical protein